MRILAAKNCFVAIPLEFTPFIILFREFEEFAVLLFAGIN